MRIMVEFRGVNKIANYRRPVRRQWLALHTRYKTVTSRFVNKITTFTAGESRSVIGWKLSRCCIVVTVLTQSIELMSNSFDVVSRVSIHPKWKGLIQCPFDLLFFKDRVKFAAARNSRTKFNRSGTWPNRDECRLALYMSRGYQDSMTNFVTKLACYTHRCRLYIYIILSRAVANL